MFSFINQWTLTSGKRYNRRSNVLPFETLSFDSLGHELIQLKHFPNLFSNKNLKFESGSV